MSLTPQQRAARAAHAERQLRAEARRLAHIAPRTSKLPVATPVKSAGRTHAQIVPSIAAENRAMSRRHWIIPITTVFEGNATRIGTVVTIDPDADFFMHGLIFTCWRVGSPSPAVPSGRYLFDIIDNAKGRSLDTGINSQPIAMPYLLTREDALSPANASAGFGPIPGRYCGLSEPYVFIRNTSMLINIRRQLGTVGITNRLRLHLIGWKEYTQ